MQNIELIQEINEEFRLVHALEARLNQLVPQTAEANQLTENLMATYRRIALLKFRMVSEENPDKTVFAQIFDQINGLYLS